VAVEINLDRYIFQTAAVEINLDRS